MAIGEVWPAEPPPLKVARGGASGLSSEQFFAPLCLVRRYEQLSCLPFCEIRSFGWWSIKPKIGSYDLRSERSSRWLITKFDRMVNFLVLYILCGWIVEFRMFDHLSNIWRLKIVWSVIIRPLDHHQFWALAELYYWPSDTCRFSVKCWFWNAAGILRWVNLTCLFVLELIGWFVVKLIVWMWINSQYLVGEMCYWLYENVHIFVCDWFWMSIYIVWYSGSPWY